MRKIFRIEILGSCALFRCLRYALLPIKIKPRPPHNWPRYATIWKREKRKDLTRYLSRPVSPQIYAVVSPSLNPVRFHSPSACHEVCEKKKKKSLRRFSLTLPLCCSPPPSWPSTFNRLRRSPIIARRRNGTSRRKLFVVVITREILVTGKGIRETERAGNVENRLTLESTPVPVPRNAVRDIGMWVRRQAKARRAGRRGIDRRGRAAEAALAVVCVLAVVVAKGVATKIGLGRVDGERLAGGAGAPFFELGIAMGAGAARHAARVVVGVLVQGHLKGAVGVAKDVAALAAVVAAREVAEVSLARGMVADGRLLVRLWGMDMLVSKTQPWNELRVWGGNLPSSEVEWAPRWARGIDRGSSSRRGTWHCRQLTACSTGRME